MELTVDSLCRTEWVEASAPGRRLRFRKDGTGHYEREATDGSRFVHENFLYRVEGDEVHLKLAHARGWTPVRARVDAQALTLARDPYAFAMEERDTGEVVLASGAGVALPSE